MITNWVTNIVAALLVLAVFVGISYFNQLQFLWVLGLIMVVVSVIDTIILAFKHNSLWKRRAIGAGIISVIFGLANYITLR